MFEAGCHANDTTEIRTNCCQHPLETDLKVDGRVGLNVSYMQTCALGTDITGRILFYSIIYVFDH